MRLLLGTSLLLLQLRQLLQKEKHILNNGMRGELSALWLTCCTGNLISPLLIRMTKGTKKKKLAWVVRGTVKPDPNKPPADDDNSAAASSDWMHPQPSNKPTLAPTVSAAPSYAPTPPPTHVPNPFDLSDGGGSNPFG